MKPRASLGVAVGVARPAPIDEWRHAAVGAGRADRHEREHADERGAERSQRAGAARDLEAERDGAQHDQHDDDQPPASRRRERGHEAEAAGERPHDRADGVGGVGEPDLPPDRAPPCPSSAMSIGNCTPATNAAGTTTMKVMNAHAATCPPRAERAERTAAARRRSRGDRRAIGRGDARRLEQTRVREAAHPRRAAAAEERVEAAAEADAEERLREDEAEGEDRAAEERREHPVPRRAPSRRTRSPRCPTRRA